MIWVIYCFLLLLWFLKVIDYLIDFMKFWSENLIGVVEAWSRLMTLYNVVSLCRYFIRSFLLCKVFYWFISHVFHWFIIRIYCFKALKILSSFNDKFIKSIIILKCTLLCTLVIKCLCSTKSNESQCTQTQACNIWFYVLPWELLLFNWKSWFCVHNLK